MKKDQGEDLNGYIAKNGFKKIEMTNLESDQTIDTIEEKKKEVLGKGAKFLSYTILAIFCCATPLGIGIGMAVEDVNKWVESFLLGLSAGTFIYTGTIHVIPEEFGKNAKAIWWKTFAYFLGIWVIFGIWFIEHKAFGGHDEH